MDGGTSVSVGSNTNGMYNTTLDYTNAVCMLSIYPEGNNPHIDIYWKDLTKEKQDEILEKLGDNGNWDVIPIVEIPENECEYM